MDPRDFCQLAQKLAKGAQPAATRSAISRAYYAAYNVGVEVLEQLHFEIPKKAGGHGIVRTCLQNAGDADVEKVGEELATLSMMRNRADYDLDRKDVEHTDTARTLVNQASYIIVALDALARDQKRRSQMMQRRPEIQQAIEAWQQEQQERQRKLKQGS